MKDKLQELYEFHQKNRVYSPWAAQLTLQEAAQKLQGEIEELLQALEKKDQANFKEELGDVLSDIMLLLIIAEEKGQCSPREVLQAAVAKFRRRKPFVMKEKHVSLEEETEMWQEAKRKEKIIRQIK